MKFVVLASTVLASVVLAACAGSTDASHTGDDQNITGGLGTTCGGFAGLRCASALHCEIKDQGADASGTCELGADVGATCGGLAGLRCKDGLTCNAPSYPDATGTCAAPLTPTPMPLPGAPAIVEGTLQSVVGIGGESTGAAIFPADHTASFELVLDAAERSAFVSGRPARVHGKKTTLSGVETHNRPAIEVTSMTVCPEAGATVSCMPPVTRTDGLCGQDQAWAEKACTGISFVF